MHLPLRELGPEVIAQVVPRDRDRGALEMKRQREEAVRQAREREEQECRRQEEARRAEEAERRRREERARIKRFTRLAEASEQYERLRTFLTKLREAAGPAESEPHLTDWLHWAETYVASVDPLERFRRRKETLKLYFPIYEYQVEKVLSHGVQDASTKGDDDDELPAAVTLYDVPMVYTSGYPPSAYLVVSIAESAVLPYGSFNEKCA